MPFLTYQQITVNTINTQTVAQLTVPTNTRWAFVQAENTGTIRYSMVPTTAAGNTPTNTFGMILQTNSPVTRIDSEDLTNFQFIAGTANTKLNIIYHGP